MKQEHVSVKVARVMSQGWLEVRGSLQASFTKLTGNSYGSVLSSDSQQKPTST